MRKLLGLFLYVVALSAFFSESLASIEGSVEYAETTVGDFHGYLFVTVKDSYGQEVEGVSIDIGGPASGAGVSFNGLDKSVTSTTVVTDSAGSAAVFVFANTVSGDFHVTATVNGYEDLAATFQLTNLPGPFNKVTVEGSNQSVAVHSDFTIKIHTEDVYGNSVGNITMLIGSSDQNFMRPGITQSTFVTSDATGQATVALTANGYIGSYYLEIRSSTGGFYGKISLSNKAGPPNFIVNLSNYPWQTISQAKVAEPFSPISIGVYDRYSNLVANCEVNVSAPSAGANIVGQEFVVQTDGGGTARINVQANTIAGSYDLVLTAGDAQALIISMINLPDAPVDIVALSGDNQTVEAGKTFLQRLVFEIQDQYSNPINLGFMDQLSIDELDGYSLYYSTERTNTQFIVTVSSYGRAGSATLRFSSALLNFNRYVDLHLKVDPGPAVAIVPENWWDGGNLEQAGVVGQAVRTPPHVFVVDCFGNGLVGETVLFEIIEGGGTLEGADTVTNIISRGALAGIWTLGTVSGFNTLRVSAPALPAILPVEFRAFGAPDAANAGSTSIKAAQNALASGKRTTISIQVNDQYGNGVFGESVVSLSASSGTLSDPVRISYEGLYQAIFTAIESGDVTITGTLNGVPIDSVATITVSDSTPPMIISPVELVSSNVESNQPVQFSINAQDTTPLTYTWNFGDGTTAVTDSGTVTHTFATAGSFTVTVTMTDLNGQSSTTSMTVVASPALPGSLCNGLRSGQIAAANLSVRLKFPSTLIKDSLVLNALIEIDGSFNTDTHRLLWNIGGLQGNADLSKSAQKVAGVKASVRINKVAENGGRTAKLRLVLKSQTFDNLIIEGVKDLKASKNNSGTVSACIVLENYRAFSVELSGAYKAVKEKAGVFSAVLKP